MQNISLGFSKPPMFSILTKTMYYVYFYALYFSMIFYDFIYPLVPSSMVQKPLNQDYIILDWVMDKDNNQIPKLINVI